MPNTMLAKKPAIKSSAKIGKKRMSPNTKRAAFAGVERGLGVFH